MKCPQCPHEIISENINIKADVAQCQDCGFVFKISESFASHENDSFNIANTPKGVSYEKENGEIRIGASTRSPIAFFLIPFASVWIGFAMSGIYGTQISSGDFNPSLSLFGIPFILGSIMLIGFVSMTIFGVVKATLNNQGGEIFTGVGKLGWTRKFSWNEISSAREKAIKFRVYPSFNNGAIALEGKRRITFGTNLNEERRYYMLKSFQTIIEKYHTRKTIF